jgi:hypothetical protein
MSVTMNYQVHAKLTRAAFGPLNTACDSETYVRWEVGDIQPTVLVTVHSGK